MRLLLIFVFAGVLALLASETYIFNNSSRSQRISQTSDVRSSHGSLKVVGDSDRDMGKVSLGDSVRISFALLNAGTEPVKITDIHPSCGCTATAIDSTLVLPGHVSTIEAIFRSSGKAEGPFVKTITVISNSIRCPITHVSFHGNLQMPSMPHLGANMSITGIFEGKCASCHSNRGVGQLGEALWKADCAICHSGSPKAPPSIEQLCNRNFSADRFQQIASNGVSNRNMPPFLVDHRGPLTISQINSLREFFEWKLAHKGNL